MITNVQIANIISENLLASVNKDEIDKIANIICDKIEEDEQKLKNIIDNIYAEIDRIVDNEIIDRIKDEIDTNYCR